MGRDPFSRGGRICKPIFRYISDRPTSNGFPTFTSSHKFLYFPSSSRLAGRESYSAGRDIRPDLFRSFGNLPFFRIREFLADEGEKEVAL